MVKSGAGTWDAEGAGWGTQITVAAGGVSPLAGAIPLDLHVVEGSTKRGVLLIDNLAVAHDLHVFQDEVALRYG